MQSWSDGNGLKLLAMVCNMMIFDKFMIIKLQQKLDQKTNN